jgi:hypothetical protein
MTKRQVFYSFHYDNDAMRVQQVRNIGAIEGNTPASANDWETVKKKGDVGIQTWIDSSMKNRSCVVVFVGSETANRKWVKYEIQKAWNDGKGLFGIYIHNLKDPNQGACKQGVNPFDNFTVGNKKLSTLVKCYNPKATDAYNDIKGNISDWIEAAIAARQ